jgi:hypothetical protein
MGMHDDKQHIDRLALGMDDVVRCGKLTLLRNGCPPERPEGRMRVSASNVTYQISLGGGQQRFAVWKESHQACDHMSDIAICWKQSTNLGAVWACAGRP